MDAHWLRSDHLTLSSEQCGGSVLPFHSDCSFLAGCLFVPVVVLLLFNQAWYQLPANTVKHLAGGSDPQNYADPSP